MHHSEYRAAADRAVAYVKTNVKYRGLNTAGGWIRNPADIPQKVSALVDATVTGIARSAAHKGGFNAETYVNEMEKLTKDTDTGNCSGLAAVAFNFLKREGVRPIDYFAVFRGGWDHAFVILNRDAKTPVADLAKWSEFAVLCDPQADRVWYAGRLATWYPQAIPLRTADVAYRIE